MVAILASNTLYEKFWQHNGVGRKARMESKTVICFSRRNNTFNLPHFSFYGVLPNCVGQTRDAPMEPYISHKNKAKREIYRSFVSNVSCAML